MTFRCFVHHFQILKVRFLYFLFVLRKRVKVSLQVIKNSTILDCSEVRARKEHYNKVWKPSVKSIPKQCQTFSDLFLFSFGNNLMKLNITTSKVKNYACRNKSSVLTLFL